MSKVPHIQTNGNTPVDNSRDRKKALYIATFLTVLTCVGLFLRLSHLSDAPYWMDEGYTINAVLSIQEKGVSVLDSGLSYSCPLYCYPTAWLADTFGDTAFSYRILSVLAGILLIPVFFIFVRRFFSTHIAYLSTFFLTFSYWHIAWAQQARWYTLFTLFFWLALLFFYRAQSRAEWKVPALLALVFTLLAVQTHALGILLFFIYPAWLFIDSFLNKKRLSWRLFMYFGAFLLLSAGIMWLFYQDIFLALFNKVHLYYTLPYYLSFYLTHYALFIVPFILVFPFLTPAYKKSAYFLLLVMLAYLIPLGFLTNIVHYRYLFHLTPAFFVLGTLAFVHFAEYVAHRTEQAQRRKALVALVYLLPIALFFFLSEGVWKPLPVYTLESDKSALRGTRPHIAYTPQPDWNEAYAYIEEHRAKGDVIVSSHPHFNKIFLGEAGYWIRFDYLGFTSTPSTPVNDREYYVGAVVLDDLRELESLAQNTHGYVVFDYMATDGRIPDETLVYIEQNFELVYHKVTNEFSEIWVYRF